MNNRVQRWEPDRAQPGSPRLSDVQTTAWRWAAWAERLGQRFTRQAMRRFGPQQILAQTSASHWIQASLSFSPQLHLTFQRGLEASPGAERAQAAPARWERQESLRAAGNPPRYTTEGPEPGEPAATRKPAGATRLDWPAAQMRHSSFGSQSGEFELQSQAAGQRGQTTMALAEAVRRPLLPGLDMRWERVEQPLVQTAAILKYEPHGEPAPSIMPGQARNPADREGEQVYELPGRLRNPPAISLPDGELERLTEQVVRKIDERIVAHRERLGRVF